MLKFKEPTQLGPSIPFKKLIYPFKQSHMFDYVVNMDMNISEFMKKYGKQLPKTYNRITF
jgi:hypothetical protein